jgi:hypothetical protein
MTDAESYLREVHPYFPGTLILSQSNRVPSRGERVDKAQANYDRTRSHEHYVELRKALHEQLRICGMLNRVRKPNQEELEWAKNRAKELGLP